MSSGTLKCRRGSRGRTRASRPSGAPSLQRSYQVRHRPRRGDCRVRGACTCRAPPLSGPARNAGGPALTAARTRTELPAQVPALGISASMDGPWAGGRRASASSRHRAGCKQRTYAQPMPALMHATMLSAVLWTYLVYPECPHFACGVIASAPAHSRRRTLRTASRHVRLPGRASCSARTAAPAHTAAASRVSCPSLWPSALL